jgi:hypothetical protein
MLEDTMERRLRIEEPPSSIHGAEIFPMNDDARVILAVDDSAEARVQVDRLYVLTEILKQKDAAHKADTESLRNEAERLKKEVLSFAQERGISALAGDEAEIVFKPRASRTILPEKLLSFLKGIGRTSDFWKYVSVPLKGPENDFGAAVLESNGVLSVDVNDYGTSRILKKTG